MTFWRIFDSAFSLTTSAYYYERLYNEYNEDRIGGRVTLGRKVSDYWSILGTVLEVYVNPRDVVSVPHDYSAQKIRVCRYVVGEPVDKPYDEPVLA